MTDFGLVSVLPAGYYLALAIVTLSFCLALRGAQRHWRLLALHVVVLLVMLHGTPAILYDSLRYPWAWKHVGIVDYIQRHGALSQGVGQFSAYQDWPGFFGFVALIVQIGDFRTALAFASWAPLLNNLLFAAAALFVFRSMTADRRLSWLAVWIFLSTNWVAQDYFAPQATAYFLYLALIGVCVRWFRPLGLPPAPAVKRWTRSDRIARTFRTLLARGPALTAGPAERRHRAPLAAGVCLIAAAIVTSHQLTPFMLILALAALVTFRLCELRGLPALVAVMTGAWVMYMSLAFLKGNLYWIIASIGSLNIGSSTLSNLGAASHGHLVVAEITRGLTVLVGVLAAAGLARRLRHGRFDNVAAVLALTPVLMVWGNAYGGEVLFRVFFFALPFLAFLAAGLVFPASAAGRSRRTSLLAVAICAPLLVGMLFSYYGNERMYYLSHDEVRSAQYLVTHARPGATLVGITTAYPWAFRDYERYSYVQAATLTTPERLRLIDDPVAQTARLIAGDTRRGGYIVFSRGQLAEAEMTGILPVKGVERMEVAISRSSRFHEVYTGPDAQIFQLVDAGAAR